MKEIDRFSKVKRNKFHGNQIIGFGESYVSTKELPEMFSKLFDSLSDAEWAVRECTSDGPNQRQLRNTLILKQMEMLMKKLDIKSGVEAVSISGTSPKEYNFEYPIGIPKEVLGLITENMEESKNWLGQGPFHEVAFDLLMMNCLSAINEKVKELDTSTSAIIDGKK